MVISVGRLKESSGAWSGAEQLFSFLVFVDEIMSPLHFILDSQSGKSTNTTYSKLAGFHMPDCHLCI